MCPTLIINNQADTRFANGIVGFKQDKRLAPCVARPHLPHLGVCEFGACTSLSSRWVGSPTLRHIARIVLPRSRSQVFGITARRVVARMQRHLPVGYWAVCEYTRKTVRSDDALRVLERDRSIAVLVPIALPFPAFALWPLSGRFIDIAPKPFLKGYVTTDTVRASPAARPTLAEFYQSIKGVKRLVATSTNTARCSDSFVGSRRALPTTKATITVLDIIQRRGKGALTLIANAWYSFTSQDVNLHRQVSFWLGSLACLRRRAGRLHFTTLEGFARA